MRLDKYLTTLGVGSRSQVKELIKKGKIKVNNQKVNKPEMHIKEDEDIVNMEGLDLDYHKFYYYMLNKPAGVLTAVSDFQCQTVLDIMDVTPKRGLFPVGRLDKDTEGLLLITNDGELSHILLSPAKHVDKKYYVEVDGTLNQVLIDSFQTGFDIGEKHNTKPAVLEIIDENKAYVTITEGKYHQVKRMFKHFGLNVTYLKRISMGTLVLDKSLEAGEYRALRQKEVDQLLEYKKL